MFSCRASYRTVEIFGDESNSNSKNRQQSFDTGQIKANLRQG
jgi:hypothetical protein